jgi:uncharacterized protein YbjT (DUF2867 family)
MKILVIGATGKTGRGVVDALRSRGADVLPASRTPGAGGVRFDWADRGTWKPALQGVEGLYTVGPYAQPNAAVLVHELLATAAAVRRIVLLSVIGADRLPDVVPMAGWERDVQESGKEWTILRPNWFQQNFVEGFLPSLRDRGMLELPAADARVSFVDTRDVAATAAAALATDGHFGRTYELTGPQALTHTEALEVLGEAAGRELQYTALDPAQHAEHMRAAGTAERSVIWQAGLFSLMRDGGNAHITDTVERITGHPARSLASFADENAAAWRG